MSETKRTFGGTVGAALRAVGRFVKRHKKLFIFLAVLLVVAVVLLVVLGGAGGSAAGAVQLPQTTTLQRMDLQQTVAATGTLQSSSTREVSSSLSYEILEVYAEEGDHVEAGDILARLDTTTIDENIASAKKSLSEAAASDSLALAQAQRKLQDAINSRDINHEKNEAAVQTALAALNNTPTDYDAIADAAMVASAEENNLRQAEYGWEQAKAANSLTDADGPTLGVADPGYTEWTALQTANANYAGKRQTAYNAALQARTTAQTTYDNAVQTRDTAYRNDSISIENARDAVNSQKLKDSAATYRTQLENYEKEKEKCFIEAPVAGTITAVNARVGQSAGSSMSATAGAAASALFTIEDTARLEITTSIPEYDVVSLEVGMPAAITSDAIDGEEWRGTVKSISAKAADANGNFTVVIGVDSPVGDLAVGMSAKINIITKSQGNVFAVPYDAVTTDEAGATVVYTLAGEGQGQNPAQGGTGQRPANAAGAEGQPAATRRAIEVKTGMETDYYIEISGAGLEEGMPILTDPEGRNVGTGATDVADIMGSRMPFGG